jgi:beta-galactosidase
MTTSRAHLHRRDALLLMSGAALSALLPVSDALAVGSGLGPGRDQDFDLGWRFSRGSGPAWEAPGLDDSGWRGVDLPHDWSIEDLPNPSPPNRVGPFDAKNEGGANTGFTLGGEGWYRKRFRLAPDAARAEIVFDGVYAMSDVWLNGHLLGSRVHGYAPFAYDLTPHLDPTGENVIAVRVRNLGENARFYTGAGIYRSVTLNVFADPARIALWGVAAWTRRLTGAGALIDVTTKIDKPERGLTLRTTLRSASGEVEAKAHATASGETRQVLRLPKPRPWAPAHPDLYTLETELLRGGRVVDRLSQPFGVRIVAFSADRGMTINGETVKIRGGCLHHDNGLLGAAAFADADERRILRLKARGYNAIRSTHYPCARTFREACERHGMLLIEEAFDVWHMHKTKDDYAQFFPEHWRADLASMVLSARNSPSVIMWSIGNEIPDRTSRQGLRYAWDLADEVHRLDPTRPVTAGVHAFSGRPVTVDRGGRVGKPREASMIFLDVPGYNYKLDDIEADHARYPSRVLYASETYPVNAFDYWALGERAPYMIGEFVWTAMDYLGEAGIGAAVRRAAPANGAKPPQLPFMQPYPWVVANCGDIDLIGVQKPQSYYRDVVWGLSGLELAVQRPVPVGQVEVISQWGWSDELQSWSWPGVERQPLAVRVYTSGDKVELRLNGALVATRALSAGDKMRAEFAVPYAPGVLEAISWRQGVEIGRKRLETVGAPAKLRIRAERPQAGSGRRSLSYLVVDVLDALGRLTPDAAIKLSLDVAGPADLLAFGSANPLAVGSLQSNQAWTYHGRALAILRAKGSRGEVRVEARGDGHETGTVTLRLA